MEIVGIVTGTMGMTFGLISFVFSIKSVNKIDILEKRLNELESKK